MNKNFVIAIDGPAGSGKSTVARLVAEKLGFFYVDTGAMYRAVTLKAMKQSVPLQDNSAIIEMVKNTVITLCKDSGYRVLLDGKDVTEEIRAEEVGQNTRYPASIIEVREILWEMQKRYRETDHIVMEGRDIGSKVFPDAQLKVFLDAEPSERAKRRYLQLMESGRKIDLASLERDIMRRDKNDQERAIATLVKLPDAVHIYTTGITIDQVVKQVIDLYQKLKK